MLMLVCVRVGVLVAGAGGCGRGRGMCGGGAKSCGCSAVCIAALVSTDQRLQIRITDSVVHGHLVTQSYKLSSNTLCTRFRYAGSDCMYHVIHFVDKEVYIAKDGSLLCQSDACM